MVAWQTGQTLQYVNSNMDMRSVTVIPDSAVAPEFSPFTPEHNSIPPLTEPHIDARDSLDTSMLVPQIASIDFVTGGFSITHTSNFAHVSFVEATLRNTLYISGVPDAGKSLLAEMFCKIFVYYKKNAASKVDTAPTLLHLTTTRTHSKVRRLIAMYVMYVVVVIAGRVIFQKWKKWRARSQAQPTTSGVGDELLTQGATLDTPPDDAQQESSPDIPTSSEPAAFPREPECGPVCVEEEHGPAPSSQGSTPIGSEESTTMPFAYIGHFLVAAPPAEEPSALVANTTGESRHYRMQATVAGVLSGVETIIPVVRPLRNVNNFRSPGVNAEEGEEEEEEDDSDGSDTAPFLDDIHVRRPVHPHPFIKLLKELWPFGEEFRSLKWTEKIYEVIKAPAGLILTLTIPVVDHEKPNDNWNKWLNVLHCVTAPLIMMLITKETVQVFCFRGFVLQREWFPKVPAMQYSGVR
ncbi:hypothetical protein EMCRGX_G007839 [Ephydatia muelleri]